MFVTYGAGFTLALWRVGADAARNDARQGGEPVPTHLCVPQSLSWLVPEGAHWSYAYDRYPSWHLMDPGFYAPALLLVLIGASVGSLASRWLPPTAMLPFLRGVPSAERRHLKRVYLAMLRRSTVSLWVWMAAASVGGLTTALLGDACAMIVGHGHLEAAWSRGAPASVVYMRPIMGCLTFPDAVVLFCWAALVPLGLVWLTTRHAFVAREGRIGWRCLSCGYPLVTHEHAMAARSSGIDAAVSVCPECGSRRLPKRPVRSIGVRVLFLLGGILVLALAMFCVTPHLTG